MQEIVFRSNDNQALTTSVIVAEKFGKEHSDVLKAIKSLFTTGEKSLFVENQQLAKMFSLTEVEQPMPVGGGVKKLPIYVMNRDGFTLLAMLIDRGYGDVQDFFKADTMPDGCKCILTNPPYKYALEFVQHSLDLLPDGGLCVMFLKTTFLEGQKRYERLYKNTPPKYVLQFSKRVLCAKNGKFAAMRNGGGSAVSYAWFVWKKGYNGETTIKWI